MKKTVKQSVRNGVPTTTKKARQSRHVKPGRAVTWVLPKEEAQLLDAAEKLTGVPKMELLKECLRRYLAKVENKAHDLGILDADEKEKAEFYRAEGIECVYCFDDAGDDGSIVMYADGRLAFERQCRIVADLTLADSIEWYSVLDNALQGGRQGEAYDKWMKATVAALTPQGGARLLAALDVVEDKEHVFPVNLQLNLSNLLMVHQVAKTTKRSISDVVSCVVRSSDDLCEWSTESDAKGLAKEFDETLNRK